MATDTLSQNEIDQLLGAGAAEARSRAARRPAEPEHVVYDFRRPHRISKDRLRTIEAMYERLAKSLEAWLMSRLRRQIELRLQSVEQHSFGEFTLSLSTPCASFGFDIRNFEDQHGVIDIGHELAFLVVDRLFGGDAHPTVMPRALTPIERLTVRMVSDRVGALITEIWQDHVALDLEMTTFESFPEMLQGGNREDPVLVANIEVAGDGLRSLLIICLPLVVLEKFFASGDGRRVKAMAGSPAERQANQQIAETTLRGVPVALTVRLPEFKVTLRELLSLGEDAVLATGLSTDTPSIVRIGGQPRFHAHLGWLGKRAAIRLGDEISQAPGSGALATTPTAFTPNE